MEMLPHLRRLSKRTLLCLYFCCAMFVACAFYTFYTEPPTQLPTTSFQDIDNNALFSHDIPFESKQIHKSYANLRLNNTVILPMVSWTSKQKNTAEGISTQSIFIPVKNNKSDLKSSNKSKPGAKYVYVTESPSGGTKTTMRSISSTIKATTAISLDTCQTYSMNNSKLILLWTPFFGVWNYITQNSFKECKRCRNCRVTHDRTKLGESDAVIFHARDMSLNDLPPVRYLNQQWIFFCLESPSYSDFPGMEHMVNMFNWTMTYRTDSDVVSQYGRIARVKPSRKLNLQSLQESFNNKSKSIVWMSSHCPTHGGRDEYVEELRKFIEVDIYGSCGSMVCPPNGTNRCLKDFASKYKFFLAFENTICKDYVTEKFFRTFQYNMVPVVFGGATYSKFAPPGSYIDALSFKSPKHLAFFLAGVGKDFKIWSAYFRWRKDYVVDMSNHRDCDLCALLHRRDLKPSSYPDLRQWWVGEGNCRAWKPKR